MDKIKNSTFRAALIAVVLPFLAAFPWIGLLTSPLAEEVIFRQQVKPYEWVLLAFFYFAYLFFGTRLKSSFVAFATASIAAFIVSITLRRLPEDSCIPRCVGFISERYGLACGYVDDACEIENFLITFVLIVLVIILYRAITNARNARKQK